MSVQAWFPSDEHSVRPGDSVRLNLTVENASPATESYTITPAGLTAAWVNVTRSTVTLFGGSRDVIEVTVRPPAISTTTAGATTLAVRIVPHTDPDAVYIAEAVVDVESFDDRRISVMQPLKRGRRRAAFEFLVENRGNSLANCRLHLIDLTDRLDGEFDPPAVGVTPGATALVRLNVRAPWGGFRRAERQLTAEIEATEPDHQPAVGKLTVIQPATLPTSLLSKSAVVVVAVAALWAAWAAIVQPAIDESVERAINAGAVATSETDSEAGAGTTATTAPVASDDEPSGDAVAEGDEIATSSGVPGGNLLAAGTPQYYRLSVQAGAAQTRSQSLVIPPDADFLLTDLVVQNPNADQGIATMLRNDEVLYRWDLNALSSGNEFQPRVSPLPFTAGDSIVLDVACATAGGGSGSCDVALLMTGVLIDPNN